MAPLMSALVLGGALAAKFAVAQEHGEEYSKTMGPVAFMWPPDREWGATQDNTAPCGSAASVVNRTDFPLLNGQIALVAQDESWHMQVAISYKSDPTSNDDFEVVIPDTRIPELNEGHQCFPLPNPPADVEAQAPATLQIRYTSDFDTDLNETFYACADITYVPTSQFTYQVPCFNATTEDFEISEPDSEESTSTGSAAGATATAEVPEATESSSSGLSGGAIAGIVVGVVVGVASALALIFVLWRRRQQKKRLRQQETSIRNVKWEAQHGSGPASQASDRDIALRNI
ncbi:hypothetical protein AYO21_11208 [Fonsecaea monophora]|uniref:Copper acquisition factor BIM1-like domain-containing protein n=1 Tax=Fonsecaea monophora TaxID=254056 RepID=A0A177EU69_9EURO|nr:hypothetical protein AYO21_11208 [Fonsecaea monophora]OAG34612.1 hypothetical protein AYO21_11208 [Fonsecaea monophora]